MKFFYRGNYAVAGTAVHDAPSGAKVDR